jgi:hypothetical protein
MTGRDVTAVNVTNDRSVESYARRYQGRTGCLVYTAIYVGCDKIFLMIEPCANEYITAPLCMTTS